MNLSKRGAGAILGHEAVYLEAYRDPAGIWTIGAGHTASAGGLEPRPGMIIPFKRAMRIFAEDMRTFEWRVLQAIRPAAIARQHRFDALVSFDFNTGAIDKGTVDDKLNRGDIDAAMATLNRYVHAGGRRLRGLVKRRREEAAMFLHARYPRRKILVKDRLGAQGRLISPAVIPWSDSPSIPLDLDRPLSPPPMPAKRPKPNFIIDLFNFVQRVGGTA